jgi:uncharacterized protein
MHLPPHGANPLVGLALGPYVDRFVRDHSGVADYVEVPFEQLDHSPETFARLRDIPLILHCSSLSVAGTIDPTPATMAAIQHWAEETNTPWVGEHLAFILGESAGCAPYNVGYTVSPQMSVAVVDLVVKRLNRFSGLFRAPLILENSPVYFSMPGSTMSQIEFIGEICHQTDVSLLLDLTHFHITACNLGFDARKALDRYPLDRVVEIHLSGVSLQSDVYWDNHAALAPEEVFELLAWVLDRTRPRAVTLEYNWLPNIPAERLITQIARVRETLADSGRTA